MKTWFEKNPKLFSSFKKEIEENYPFLRVVKTDRQVLIKGTYELVLNEILVERLHILILIPSLFPKELPALFEIGGRFPKNAKRHFFLNTKACLFVEEERFKYWPSNSIKDFIDGPVRNFFVSQVHFEKTGKWPFGDRGHDAEGIMQFYREYLDIHNYRVLLRFLEYFADGKIKGSHICPCGSGKTIRKCRHNRGVMELGKNVGRPVFKNTLKRLNLIVNEKPNILSNTF